MNKIYCIINKIIRVGKLLTVDVHAKTDLQAEFLKKLQNAWAAIILANFKGQEQS